MAMIWLAALVQFIKIVLVGAIPVYFISRPSFIAESPIQTEKLSLTQAYGRSYAMRWLFVGSAVCFSLLDIPYVFSVPVAVGILYIGLIVAIRLYPVYEARFQSSQEIDSVINSED